MKTITNIAVCNLKKERTRSLLIILSIFLTTVLLSMIGAFGCGLIRDQKTNTGVLYGDYYGSFSQVSEEQAAEMELHSEFREIGKSAFVATVKNKDADMSLSWTDKIAAKSANVTAKLEQGSLPREKTDITAQKEFFQKLGVQQPKVGDTVKLSYRVDNRSKYQEAEFTIKGILKSAEINNLSSAYGAYVSEEFMEAAAPKEQRSYLVLFKLKESISVNYDNIEGILKDLAKEYDIPGEHVSVNKGYIMWAFDPGTETITVCAGIALLVVLISALVIYNILQVGVIQKVQEYGKIKAIGASRKQMKSILFREGMVLAAIGIPTGLLAGTAGGALIFRQIMSADTMNNGIERKAVSAVSVPLLFLVAAAALFTVWLALKHPMKVVASASPMEAVRYQESQKKGKNLRKGKTRISVAGMTLSGLRQHRRRTISTICTMGLSCMLFVLLSNVAGNIDNEYEVRKMLEYGRFAVELDYSLGDEAYPENNLYNIQKNNPLNQELLGQIKAIPGVTGVKSRNVLAVKGPGEGEERVSAMAVLSREEFEKFTRMPGADRNLDYDEVTKKNGIVYGWAHGMEEYGYKRGQKMDFELMLGGKEQEYRAELMGVFGNPDFTWAVTEDTWKNLGITQELTGILWVECKEKDVSAIEKNLRQILEGKEHIEVISYEDSMKTVEMGTGMMQGAIYGFLGILGVIGFMNMANTIITSVVTRRRELGILQAVGMTNRQLNQMLQLEGIIFSAGTVLISLLLGCPLGYALFQYAKENGIYGLNLYHAPVAEIGVMIGAVVLLQIMLSFLLSRNLRKDSLVERIRYQG